MLGFIGLYLVVLLISNLGIRVLLGVMIPGISYLTSLLVCFSVSLFLIMILSMISIVSKGYEHELMVKRMNAFDNEIDDFDDDYDDDEEDDESKAYCPENDNGHSWLEYDKSGRPFCPDCRAYQDEIGGYYAANREERRRLQKVGLE